jgi:hypothetical protein
LRVSRQGVWRVVRRVERGKTLCRWPRVRVRQLAMPTPNDSETESWPARGNGIGGFGQKAGFIPTAQWAVGIFPYHLGPIGLRNIGWSDRAAEKHNGPSMSRIVGEFVVGRVADQQR